MNLIYYIVAVLIGAIASIQVGVNSSLKLTTGNALYATFTNFTVGWIAVFILVLIESKGNLGMVFGTILSADKWKLVGGLLGASFVTSLVIIAPKIGMTSTLTLVIAGQIILAMILDHFGWLGMHQQPISWMKIIGVMIMVVGVYIVQTN
ncbi:DMT family transporter [Persicobacter psychrovividus]|uniref:DMT family transporter n=1 Tax=Persicobacter psychrovividus TaxID=387638 RepID=A0ABM7VHA7_9BACT|nr:hypothetical protein PEPS_26320 [Persicobacter psychrovividus]